MHVGARLVPVTDFGEREEEGRPAWPRFLVQFVAPGGVCGAF